MRKRSSRTAPRNAGAGEIVEVHGGRIVRSTGGKDRHSKVCTAKGTRDRRVRLAAHTAIQFYDVQDRLGFDRPSRAVDWLINKAKAAIDELDELPPWNPTTALLDCNSGKSKTLGGGDEAAEDGGEGDVMYGSSSLLPPSMDSDAAIADTIKSSTPLDVQFQSYPSADLLQRRSSSQSQDLKLSLQSLQDPILTQSHHHSRGQNQEEEEDSRLFPDSAQIGFDNPSASWAENQRLIGWNSPGGFMFIPPQASQQPLLFGHGVGSNGVGQTATQFFSQRGPLQSSNSPPNGAQIGAGNNQNYHQAIPSLSGFGFASSGGFSGFPFAAQIRGDQEDHDGGDPNNPSSVSSASRH